MRDWTAHVSARLAELGLDAEREAEIRAELAGHLEDAYADAVRRGCEEDDAVACALEQVPDWTYLADVIRRADREGDPMTRDARTLLLPGMAMLCCASVMVFGLLRFVPPSVWTDDRLVVRLLAPAILLGSYLAFGALGAAWSRRAGGGVAARFVAGIFPLALHLAIIIATIAASLLAATLGRPEPVGRVSQLGALGFVIIPGFALTVGALPFLRDIVTSSAPSGTRDLPTRG